MKFYTKRIRKQQLIFKERYFVKGMLVIASMILVAQALATFPHSINAQALQPVAPVIEVKEDYFGVTVTDPYRWMEDMASPATESWMKAQADFASQYLRRLPERDAIRDRFNELSNAAVAVKGIQTRGNGFFFMRRGLDEQDFSLYVRDPGTGKERLLLDPASEVRDGRRYSIGTWTVSFDGKYVAFNLAAGGAENGEIRVIEVSSGRRLPEVMDRIRNSSISWLPDNSGFLYTRLQEMPVGAAESQRYLNRTIYLHKIGEPSARDRAILGNGVDQLQTFDPALVPLAITDRDSKYVIAQLYTTAPNSEFYIAEIADLGKTRIPWRRIVSFDDKVSSLELRNDAVFALTYKDAPRYKIVETRLPNPDLSRARTVFQDPKAVVKQFVAKHDGLYVQQLDGGERLISRVDYRTKKAVRLQGPYDGAMNIAASEGLTDGIYYEIVSWVKSSAHYRFDPTLGRSVATGLIPPHPVDKSHITYTKAMARSYDGVMVPMVLVYKKGMKPNGENPAFISGYGAYGIEITSPTFDTNGMPFIERGGIAVICGVRGGGEYGEEWHKAGYRDKKPNSWKDFIACAEYLIKHNYTQPRHLGLNGGSAGGIIVSNAIAERPELFRLALIRGGVTNPMRLETTPIGPTNVGEYGSIKTEEGFRNLLAMDAYLKIRDGVKYPAVLFGVGRNDPRVPPWMSAKLAARLQKSSVSGRPVLLRIDYDAGHGQGITREQLDEELADNTAFLLSELR
jgi:prolyl oligopeptidase